MNDGDYTDVREHDAIDVALWLLMPLKVNAARITKFYIQNSSVSAICRVKAPFYCFVFDVVVVVVSSNYNKKHRASPYQISLLPKGQNHHCMT